MYFVTEFNEMSAPNLRGFWRAGDMKVLSTTKMQPFSLQTFATAAMSMHFRVGLVGDSIQTILVFFFIEDRSFFMQVKSAKSHVMPV